MAVFKLIKTSNKNSLRIGKLKTRRGVINTPFFMPIATVGAVKTVAPWELKELGAQIILANAYHLYLRPGEKLVKQKFGSLHNFMKWNGPVLTDSGGYQVFSLSEPKSYKLKAQSLVRIKNDGVEFKSHLDGSKHFFTPEKVIQIQLDLGSDIIMPLDICPKARAPKKDIEKAVNLTIKWAKCSQDYLAKSYKLKANRPLLFGIVQGGTNKELRGYCANELIKLDFDGYAVGGLAVGEKKTNLWRVVQQMNKILPADRPRYLMGVGTPNDIIKATSLGMDMFDCVLPTRLARHGSAWLRANSYQPTAISYKKINLLNSKYKNDTKPLDEKCNCPTCKNKFSKSYIHHLIKEKEVLGIRLLTLHNLWLYLNLMRKIGKNMKISPRSLQTKKNVI